MINETDATDSEFAISMLCALQPLANTPISEAAFDDACMGHGEGRGIKL